MIRRSRRQALSAVLPVLILAGALAAAAQDGGLTNPAYNEPRTNRETDRSDLGNVAQSARFALAEGKRELKRAEKLEKKLASVDPGKREDLEKKIHGAYESAVAKLTDAVRLSPKQAEGYAALGDAYGRLGKHAERLQVHSAGLKAVPGDEENFRGWASALLELNLLGDATRAWDHFHDEAPPLADILFAEMEDWLERRRQDPADLAGEDIERLASWLAERG